jgi:hypothetical protein
VFAAIIRRLKQAMEPEVPKVLSAVFEPTLQVRMQLLCNRRMWLVAQPPHNLAPSPQTQALVVFRLPTEGARVPNVCHQIELRIAPHAAPCCYTDDHGQLRGLP